VAASVVAGLGAFEMDTRVVGADVAVVRRSLAVTSDPALGMDRGPVLGTGELVRVVVRRGSWTRVAATDARAGWVPDAALVFLADRRVPRD
jgi:hypothetical protein